MFSYGAHIARDGVIIDMRRFLAVAAHQEDAVMMATWMGVGDVGVRAFDTHRDIVRHEQVKDAVDAVWRHPLAPCLGNIVGNVVG